MGKYEKMVDSNDDPNDSLENKPNESFLEKPEKTKESEEPQAYFDDRFPDMEFASKEEADALDELEWEQLNEGQRERNEYFAKLMENERKTRKRNKVLSYAMVGALIAYVMW